MPLICQAGSAAEAFAGSLRSVKNIHIVQFCMPPVKRTICEINKNLNVNKKLTRNQVQNLPQTCCL